MSIRGVCEMATRDAGDPDRGQVTAIASTPRSLRRSLPWSRVQSLQPSRGCVAWYVSCYVSEDAAESLQCAFAGRSSVAVASARDKPRPSLARSPLILAPSVPTAPPRWRVGSALRCDGRMGHLRVRFPVPAPCGQSQAVPAFIWRPQI